MYVPIVFLLIDIHVVETNACDSVVFLSRSEYVKFYLLFIYICIVLKI